MYVPVEPLQDRLDVLEVPSVTLGGVSEQVSPVEGAVELVRPTVPARPLTAPTVIKELAEVAEVVVTLDGFADSVKSCIPPTV
jgi:hypothetical protein